MNISGTISSIDTIFDTLDRILYQAANQDRSFARGLKTTQDFCFYMNPETRIKFIDYCQSLVANEYHQNNEFRYRGYLIDFDEKLSHWTVNFSYIKVETKAYAIFYWRTADTTFEDVENYLEDRILRSNPDAHNFEYETKEVIEGLSDRMKTKVTCLTKYPIKND